VSPLGDFCLPEVQPAGPCFPDRQSLSSLFRPNGINTITYDNLCHVVNMLLAVFCLASRGSEPAGDRLSVGFARDT